jgi:hypothetical protein
MKVKTRPWHSQLVAICLLGIYFEKLNVKFYWITNNGQIFLKSEMIYIYCDKKQLDICGNFIYYDIKMPIFRKSFVKTSSFWILCLVVFFWLSKRSKPESITFNDRQSTDNVTISPALTLTTERLSNLWLSTRDKIQRKSTLPSNYGYGLQFKNLRLLLCILLAGDIATNPGPVAAPGLRIWGGIWGANSYFGGQDRIFKNVLLFAHAVVTRLLSPPGDSPPLKRGRYS